MSPTTLATLARAIPGATPTGDAPIASLAYDSRSVTPGALFVAVVGERFDGHAYLEAVLATGAVAVVQQADRVRPVPAPTLVVPSTRAALAPLACAFYDNPTASLRLAGVTGTNGKTTTVRMIDAIARAAGEVTGTIGTLGATVAGQDLPGERTTPEAPDLQQLFAALRDAGAASAAVEVASHALALGRVEGCRFDIGVFTNLTQDHLDFHGTMDAYRDAKGLLFTAYADAAHAAGKTFTAVLNGDDLAGRHYAALTHADRTLIYAASGAADPDIAAHDIVLGVDRIRFTARTPAGTFPVTLGFGGTFQVANALAAVGYGIARGFAIETIQAGLAECPPVPGRFQPVRVGQDFAVLIDYAHTPDGIENVLRAARPLTKGRLTIVFGCGGDRDRTKRPLMGRLAQSLADCAILTSDNPRTEDPEAILDEIAAGLDGSGAEILREADRRTAIRTAIRGCRAGDTLVIAGKGHEDYQILADRTIAFSDFDVAEEELTTWLSR
jgi:UDP-N-acetylmuramoyl-L-alanyl-D-glutamate--2,6-diaminopimelate ligase